MFVIIILALILIGSVIWAKLFGEETIEMTKEEFDRYPKGSLPPSYLGDYIIQKGKDFYLITFHQKGYFEPSKNFIDFSPIKKRIIIVD